MIRITIDWNLISPVLKVVTGVLTIDDIDYIKQHYETLLKCNVKVEPGCTGFTAIDEDNGIPSKVLKKYDNHIQDLMRAYLSGVLLNDSIYSWVNEEDEV